MPRKEGRDGVDGDHERHMPFWPPSYSHKRSHKLCYLCPLGDGQYRVWWSEYDKSEPIGTYAEWKALLSQHSVGIDCYVGELGIDGTGFPWITQALSDPHAKVKCSRNGGVTSIAVRVGKLHLAVSSLNSWSQYWSSKDPLEMLCAIRELGEQTQTGSNLTPGSLGTNVMHRVWKGTNKLYPRVSRCTVNLLEKLKEYAIAGRVETFTDHRVMHAIELDMRSAYASCCQWIPWGTPRRVWGTHSAAEVSNKYATWFCSCTASIAGKLAISPVPIRVKGRWTWATKPGVYKTWMWREEVEACIRAGIYVEVHEGWGWKSLSNRLQPWVQQMEEYRSFYESIGRVDMAQMIKRCTVAAIGWLGCYLIRYTLEGTYRKGNIPLVESKGSRPISTYSMRPYKDVYSPSPNHLHTYILMRCRLKVYERELQELYTGNEILVVNFDAIHVVRPSKLPIGRGLGEWKEIPREAGTEEGLYPRPRWMNDREKVTLPGVPRNSPLRHRYSFARSVTAPTQSDAKGSAEGSSAQSAGSTDTVPRALWRVTTKGYENMNTISRTPSGKARQ